MQVMIDRFFTFLLWIIKQIGLLLLRITGIALAALCILTGNLLLYIGKGLEGAVLRKLNN